ncbi:MAG: beta-ketoacyl-[acyl-carrier-protein] synthase family protein [Fimbriimonadaceae bacterium]|nr:beta-ketoacyl-[acyl-carrier-protein] synthase family protein [Fimbriimonadaceae bacterium]
MPRVVVTGLGVLSALGRDVPTFLDALREGRSGLGLLQHFDRAWFHTQVAAELPPGSFDEVVPAPEQRHLDPYAVLALAAAQEAVTQAGFSSEQDPYRCGVVLGSGMGPSLSWDEAFLEVYKDERKPRPTTVPKCMYNAAPGLVSIRHHLRGPSHLVVTACSSSANAIGQATMFIRTGVADAMLAGGTEAFPARPLWAAWDTLRVMSRDNDRPTASCRPFNRDRSGFVMGEGAAMLVLESEDRARSRGAHILAEVAGCGLSSDAAHLTRPEQAGFTAALRGALADARIDPSEVQYVNAHGTGTPTNDPIECAALREVFGSHAERLAVSSTKSAHGHTIGAAGAIEATACILAIQHGFVPPTLHLDDPDPACDLDCVPQTARELALDTVLSNSFAFGGHNAVLVLRRYRG